MTINYVLDKECKGFFRFAPDREGEKEIGTATIYLNKHVCKTLGIDPQKGFTLKIEPKK